MAPDDPVAAWNALDWAVRRKVRFLARSLRPHPDPAVAAVAARYATHRLSQPEPHRLAAEWLPMLLGMTWMLLVAILALVAGRGLPPGGRLAIIGIGVISGLPGMYVFEQARPPGPRILARVEMASRLAAAPPEPEPAIPAEAAGGGADGGTTAIRLRPDLVRREMTRRTGSAVVTGLGVAGSILLLPRPAGPVLAFPLALLLAIFVFNAVSVGVSVIPRAMSRRPVVTLDAAGVTFPGIPAPVAWPEIAEVRVYPMRKVSGQALPRSGDQDGRGDGGPAKVLAFIPRDPAALTAALPARMVTRTRRVTSLYGSPLAVADRLLDHSAAQIIEAAAGFAPIQVRRYD